MEDTPRAVERADALAGAQKVLALLTRARQAERTARDGRDDFVWSLHQQGLSPGRISQILTEAADSIPGLDEDEREQLGVSASAVRLTIRLRVASESGAVRSHGGAR